MRHLIEVHEMTDHQSKHWKQHYSEFIKELRYPDYVEEFLSQVDTKSFKSKIKLVHSHSPIGELISQSGMSVKTSRSSSRHKLYQCTKCEESKRKS